MKLLLPLIVILTLASCHRSHATFDPMTNFPAQDTVYLDFDTDADIWNGLVMPTASQTPSGAFLFEYDTHSSRQLYYKIYYQNDTYKFPETDSLAYENFYGSWEDVSIGFKPVPRSGHICDSFRIVGNPRDEKIYYGAPVHNTSPEDIAAVEKMISSDPAWYSSIKQKAETADIPVSQQLHLDAQWVIAHRLNRTQTGNHRWKRNPRVGAYSFLLVICDAAALSDIPHHIQYIGEKSPDGQFENPYSYFRHTRAHLSLIPGNRILKTRVVLKPSQGLFIDMLGIRSEDCDLSLVSQRNLASDSLFRHAHFQQFFPAISRQYTLRNVPFIDTLDKITEAQYRQYLTYAEEHQDQLRNGYPTISHTPGLTAYRSDSTLIILNPASTPDHLRKESTGIKSRIGLTYGRFRGKMKFPPMLNAHNIWNGLTYAFWLIYQDENPWNYRRPSYRGGYIDKNDESSDPQRLKDNFYSEIDIEMVKTSPAWPEDYNGRKRVPKPEEIVYACTNWDLACPDPEHFASGISTIRHNHSRYEAMRWYPNYKALTIKSPIPNSIFESPYYYYEIEWHPNEIIWRLGPDPLHMKEVGYMSDRQTSIPNNQMLCVMTQEYHYSEWWPPILFSQGAIPYSATDISGTLFEIVVE